MWCEAGDISNEPVTNPDCMYLQYIFSLAKNREWGQTLIIDYQPLLKASARQEEV